MASILLRAPLLFIDGPPMVTIMRVENIQEEKDESTSIFWLESSPDEETTATEKGNPDFFHVANRQPQSANSHVVKKLKYLAEPFQRNAYRPLQFLVNEQMLTGEIVSLSDSHVAIQVVKESKEVDDVRSLAVDEIEEVFWRGTPFL